MIAQSNLFNILGLGLLIFPGCIAFGGGGEDSVTIEMPFAYGYSSQCMQGVEGSTSHTYTSTRYDIDFDTPNYTDDYIYAPIGGTAFVHDDASAGFGIHINIDLGDGTYIILGHLDDTLIQDGQEVAQGQLIAIEGTTGISTGDHLHIGRHSGNAVDDGVLGASIEGLMIRAYDADTGDVGDIPVGDFVCDLYSGHYYQSRMQAPMWHPDGTLVMTPNSPDVYVLWDGYKHLIDNEAVFWSYNWDFTQLVYADETELSCYENGATLTDEVEIKAVYSDSTVWLLVGAQDGEDNLRYRVSSEHWQSILQSWGIMVSSLADISTDTSDFDEFYESSVMAQLREGSLVTEASSSDVYIIIDGSAQPVETWEAYLALGFYSRNIISIEDGGVREVMGSVGDCSTTHGCVTYDDLMYCYGESWGGDGEEEFVDTGDTGDHSSDSTITCYVDSDNDGHGNGNYYIEFDSSACPDGYADIGDDWCDDDPSNYTYEDCLEDDQVDDTGSDPDDGMDDYVDVDRDGFSYPEDCNDDDADIYPGADEYCNGHDDNCDGFIDEDSAVDATVWYEDADSDGYGSIDSYLVQCQQPSDYVWGSSDYCDNNYAAVTQEECEEAGSSSSTSATEHELCVVSGTSYWELAIMTYSDSTHWVSSDSSGMAQVNSPVLTSSDSDWCYTFDGSYLKLNGYDGQCSLWGCFIVGADNGSSNVLVDDGSKGSVLEIEIDGNLVDTFSSSSFDLEWIATP